MIDTLKGEDPAEKFLITSYIKIANTINEARPVLEKTSVFRE